MSSSTTASWRACSRPKSVSDMLSSCARRAARRRAAAVGRAVTRVYPHARARIAREAGGTRIAREGARAPRGRGRRPRGGSARATHEGHGVPDPPDAEDAQAEAQRAARRERLVLERHGDLVDHDDEDEVEEQLEPLDLLREREPARRRARAAVRRVLVEELDVLHVHVVVVELARRRLVLQHGTRLACALQRGGLGAQNRGDARQISSREVSIFSQAVLWIWDWRGPRVDGLDRIARHWVQFCSLSWSRWAGGGPKFERISGTCVKSPHTWRPLTRRSRCTFCAVTRPR